MGFRRETRVGFTGCLDDTLMELDTQETVKLFCWGKLDYANTMFGTI